MKRPENVLAFVNINTIHFDQQNPRGENEEQIINDKDFIRLRKSIKDIGVIVPIVVRPNNEIENHFYLIDGERRLRASIIEKVEEVPVRIVKNEIDGKIIAYQIHMHRKDWTRNTEAKAIMSIIEDEKKNDKNIDEETLKRKLIEITDHTSKEIKDFLNLFKYPKDIIDLVINNRSKYPISYIDQIEASFISPLKRKYKNLYNKYGENELRKILGYKFTNGLLVKTRYLMDTFNVVFQNKIHKKEIEKILDSFLSNKGKSIKLSFEEFNLIGKKRSGKKATNKKVGESEEEEIISYKEKVAQKKKKIMPTKKEQTSVNNLIDKYNDPKNKYSKEEYEYIFEAINCIEEICYKAATLMIWSTGISRIQSYIEKNLKDFIESSKYMHNNPNQINRGYINHFKLSAKTIDDVKLSAFDPQLLCYLYHKRIITVTQFKKLKGIYDTRNDSAHPTDIDISTNRIVEIFDNIYDLILNNKKLP